MKSAISLSPGEEQEYSTLEGGGSYDVLKAIEIFLQVCILALVIFLTYAVCKPENHITKPLQINVTAEFNNVNNKLDEQYQLSLVILDMVSSLAPPVVVRRDAPDEIANDEEVEKEDLLFNGRALRPPSGSSTTLSTSTACDSLICPSGYTATYVYPSCVCVQSLLVAPSLSLGRRRSEDESISLAQFLVANLVSIREEIAAETCASLPEDLSMVSLLPVWPKMSTVGCIVYTNMTISA